MNLSKYLIFSLTFLAFPACSNSDLDPNSTSEQSLAQHGNDDCDEHHGGFKSSRYEFPVTLASGTSAKVVGYLYYHGSPENRTLLIADHGATYDHQYWNAATINGRPYSFACYMAKRKYAVLALDNLGTGESTGEGTIPGDAIALSDVEDALNQVTTQLRRSHNPTGRRFEKVVLVGHSLGSLTAIGVQAAHHPADALVVTGWSHVVPPGGVALDPGTFAQLAATPYVRLPAPLRGPFFFGPTVDPDMLTYDANQLAAQLPRGVFLSGFSIIYQAALTGATQVTGRVLVQLGENDGLFPSSGASAETASYPNAQLTIQTIAQIGHCFNLHPENVQSWQRIDAWLRSCHLGDD